MSARTLVRRVLALVILLGLAALAAPVFATPATQTPSVVSFGLFTDLHAHDLDSPVERKWMTHTAERLQAFTDAMNARAVDFVIQLGDFVNGWVVLGVEPGDPARMPSILAWADGLYAAFRGPRYHVIGNHDVYNLDKATIQSVLGLERTYESFDAGPFHFVILDVQFAPDGQDLAHTYTGVAGYLPEPQLAWLRGDLAAHAGRPTIVFVHQMLDAFVEEWGRPLIGNQPDVQRVLEASGDVVAVFQGHDHRAAERELGGIRYVTFAALVDQGQPASWAVVTLDANAQTVTIEGTGAQPSFAFSF